MIIFFAGQFYPSERDRRVHEKDGPLPILLSYHYMTKNARTDSAKLAWCVRMKKRCDKMGIKC